MPWPEQDAEPDRHSDHSNSRDDSESGSILGPSLVGLFFGYMNIMVMINFMYIDYEKPPDMDRAQTMLFWGKVFAVYYAFVILLVFVLFAFRRRAVRKGAFAGIAIPWLLLLVPGIAAFVEAPLLSLTVVLICASLPVLWILGEFLVTQVIRLRAWWF